MPTPKTNSTDEEYQRALASARQEVDLLTGGDKSANALALKAVLEYAGNQTDLSARQEDLSMEQCAWKTIFEEYLAVYEASIGVYQSEEAKRLSGQFADRESLDLNIFRMVSRSMEIEKLMFTQANAFNLHFDIRNNPVRSRLVEINTGMFDESNSLKRKIELAQQVDRIFVGYKTGFLFELRTDMAALRELISIVRKLSGATHFGHLDADSRDHRYSLILPGWLDLVERNLIYREKLLYAIDIELSADTMLSHIVLSWAEDFESKQDMVKKPIDIEKIDKIKKQNFAGKLIDYLRTADSALCKEREEIAETIFGKFSNYHTEENSTESLSSFQRGLQKIISDESGTKS